MKRALTLPLAAENVNVTVRKQADAGQQVAYAQGLIPSISTTAPHTRDRYVAVANVAANLQAVQQFWPDDTSAIHEATTVLANVYARAGMPHSALQVVNSMKGTHDHRMFIAAGLANQQLGDITDAATAFGNVERYFNAQIGDPLENIAGLNDVASFYEAQKGYPDAARVLRRIADLPVMSSIDRVVYLQRALEATIKSGDRVQARRDLDILRSAHVAAMSLPRSAAQQLLLNQVADAIERYTAVLK
jgi:hypothetical protein